MSILQATFKMAFAGKTSFLSENLEVRTNGLLSKLVDKQVIVTKQREHVEVCA